METVFIIAILIFSIVIHEVAHGGMANSIGDPTAKYAGRLTLNPLKHLDPIGSFFVPFLLIAMRAPFIVGWAKPVPINPYNFNDQKYGRLKVSLAGPLSNLLIATLFGIGSRLIPLASEMKGAIVGNFLYSTETAITAGFWGQVFYLCLVIVFINTLLAVFNLMPIPPLDGSHILFTIFPSIEEKTARLFAKIGFIGVFLLLFLFLKFFPYIIQAVLVIFKIIIGV